MENTETVEATELTDEKMERFMTAVLSRLADIDRKVMELHAYVAKIEKEAHDSMAGLMSPDAMMDLAGKFLGGK